MKIEHMRIPAGHDLRVRLTDTDRDNIKHAHRQGESIHSISKLYGVNRRLIQFIVYPERLARHKELSHNRTMEGRYKKTTEEIRDRQRKHRAHKKESLIATGILTGHEVMERDERGRYKPWILPQK
jgi:hypothetical protein